MKRIIAFLLAMTIMMSSIQIPVFAAEEPEIKYYTFEDDSTLSHEERYEEYITQLFYGNDIAFFNTTAGERLSQTEKQLYDLIVPFIREVANGQRSSTIFTVDNTNNSFESISRVIDAIRADCPYEIYWMDLFTSYSQSSWQTSIYFSVAATYRGTDEYTANTAITGAASKAVNNAKNIIKKYASKGDYEKLLGYKNEICNLVEYNYDAAYDPYYYSYDSNPWALIYVFDGDNSTNVVCEGYSKSFKYLCDNTNFTGDIICNLVTGDNHMWNIVSVNDKNYRVDITGSTPTYNGRFMTGGHGNIYDGYTFQIGNGSEHYSYYDETLELWGTDADSILWISETDFDPSTYVPKKDTCKNGHTPASAVKENQVNATCTKAGSYDEVVYCAINGCNAEISRTKKTIKATGHVENTAVNENIVSATCEKDGGYDSVIYCKACKAELLRKHITIKAEGHKYGDYISNGDGTKTKTCEICKASITIDESVNVVRIKGKDRYATSFAIANETKAKMGVDKFNTIIVASGTNFADALAGSYLAKVKGAPILMSSGKDGNINDIKTFVQTNLKSGGMVYILGGTAAVNQQTEDTLKGISGVSVKRLKGKDRYRTNIEILKEAGVTNQDILVATGANFADSLSASAAGKPILLVDGKKSLTNSQKEYLNSLTTSKLYILGGTGAVGANYESELAAYGSVERVKGASRYETSVAIAQKFFANPDYTVLAYAENFPDGLCGGPLAMTMNAPLILTKTGKQAEAKRYVQAKGITNGAVLGGASLIDDPTVIDIFKRNAVATPTPTPTAKPVVTPTPTPTTKPVVTPTPTPTPTHTPEPTPASTLKISMTTYPTTIVKGKSFSIAGKVTSNSKISEVAGAIYDANGKKVQGVSVKPNATSLNIGTSNINNKLYFGQLAVGTYTLKIAAKDAAGTYVDWSTSFTVNASSLKISMTTYPKTVVKGKSFSIEGKVTSNAKITEVAGAIYDSSGKKVQGVSVKPNATSLTIETSNINNRLYFGQLAVGTYTLKIAAKDAAGTYVDWSKSFTVNNG